MSFLGNKVVFAALYIILMIPTYLLPFLGSNSALIWAGAAESGTILPQTVFHLLALLGLIIITWIRGTLIDKKWLVIFPILATVFDFVPGLSLVPLVATAMHLIVIVVGVSQSKDVVAES